MSIQFMREDWKMFRNLETLCQKAGVHREYIARLVIKELVDNALDISGDCELSQVGENGLAVSDSGDGIDPDMIEIYFSINRPMVSSKLLRLPSRGALGNGLRVVTGAAVSTGGELTIATRGRIYSVLFNDDGTSYKKDMGPWNGKGTRIEVIFGTMQVEKSDFNWGQAAIRMAKAQDSKPFKGKTSPYWYTSESFYEVCNASNADVYTLSSLFHGADQQVMHRIEDSFGFEDITTKDFSFEKTELLLEILRSSDAAKIKPTALGQAGNYAHNGLYNKQTGSFRVRTARGKHDAEIPFVAEAWVNYHSKDDTDEKSYLWTFVNNTVAATDVKIHTAYKLNASQNNSGALNEKDIILANLRAAIYKTSGGGTHIFSLRQLYYGVRPYVMEALDKEPEYNYFCRIISEYENEYGDIKGMYRDPRGILYHPHSGEEIPLGTIAVSKYNRPEWTFNKIIFIEKEGYFASLKDVKFPERYDCALITSKGFANRAVKDVFDLLGETDEEITFFCVHDSDAAGTMIYETLQHSTISRPGRKVKIINLGLDPEEAIQMGLQVETFKRSDRKRAVANYLAWDWEDWLQTNRVELNAMTTPQFIQWLEEKMEQYGHKKVVPTEQIILNKLQEESAQVLRQRLASKLLAEAGFNDKYQEALVQLNGSVESLNGLREDVQEHLDGKQEDHWSEPIKSHAQEIVSKIIS